MIQLVIGAGLGLVGGVAAVVLHRANKKAMGSYEDELEDFDNGNRRFRPDKPVLINPLIGAVPIAVGAAIVLLSSFYAQDIGEAVVLRNFGGSIAGHTSEAGLHLKAPWQDAIGWDIRLSLIHI